MTKKQFYWIWVRQSLTGSVGKAQLIAFVLTIIGGGVAYFLPQLTSTLSIVIWAIPLALLIGMWVVGLCTAPFVMYRSLEKRTGQEIPALQLRVSELEERRPRIEVEPVPQGNYVRLQVTNHGSAAEFKAQASLRQPGPQTRSPWHIHWRGTHSITQKINKGDNHILDVASRESVPDLGTAIRFHTPKLATGVDDFGSELYSYHFDEYPNGNNLFIQMEITSDPELRQAFCHRYRIFLVNEKIVLEPFETCD